MRYTLIYMHHQDEPAQTALIFSTIYNYSLFRKQSVVHDGPEKEWHRMEWNVELKRENLSFFYGGICFFEFLVTAYV